MKTSVRWVGLYLLHLLIATLGVGLATAILLEAILKPLLGRGIISIATGPYYPLEIVLAAIAGYFGYGLLRGQSSFLGVGSADSVSSDEDNPVDTNHCSRRTQLAHNIGALLRRNASALSRREYHHTVLHDPVVCVRRTFGRGKRASLPASE